MLSAMEYPHWMMIAGAVFIVLGFVGFAFHRNRNPEPPTTEKQMPRDRSEEEDRRTNRRPF